ncbi:MAG: hypothetical protein WCV55_02675 [Candidatus Paceibacterota bacterium]
MGDIIYPDFKNESSDYRVVKAEELVDQEKELKDLLKERKDLIESEEQNPEWARDLDNLKKWKDEADRINEWLTNLSTQSEDAVKIFIDSMKNSDK